MAISVSNPLVRSAVLEDLTWIAELNGYAESTVMAVYKLLTSTLEGDSQQRELLNEYLAQNSGKALGSKFFRNRG